jgi:hypothetical protein
VVGAIFLTGYAGYFLIDRIWPGFYYLPVLPRVAALLNLRTRSS